jgi:hypothetical protein
MGRKGAGGLLWTKVAGQFLDETVLDVFQVGEKELLGVAFVG